MLGSRFEEQDVYASLCQEQRGRRATRPASDYYDLVTFFHARQATPRVGRENST